MVAFPLTPRGLPMMRVIPFSSYQRQSPTREGKRVPSIGVSDQSGLDTNKDTEHEGFTTIVTPIKHKELYEPLRAEEV